MLGRGDNSSPSAVETGVVAAEEKEDSIDGPSSLTGRTPASVKLSLLYCLQLMTEGKAVASASEESLPGWP